MPPPVVHNALEAGAVRVIEVVSSLTFQAPERLLLGVTQAADALFTTLGATGNVGTALAATGASIAAKSSTTPVRPSFTKRALDAVTAPLQRIDKADNDTPPAPSSATGSPKPAAKHDAKHGDGDRHGARHAAKHDAQGLGSQRTGAPEALGVTPIPL